jgi:2-keto-4-pentenoate hydratase/2-oxohepta-3-ene-1,7-dioic acid hydratase in catechol pathway
MRLLTYLPGAVAGQAARTPSLGLRLGAQVLDVGRAAELAGTTSTTGAPALPTSMKALLAAGPAALGRVAALQTAAQQDPARFASACVAEASVNYLPPIPDADKFLCVGKNYRAHLAELQRTDLIREIPQEPTAFIKLNSCLVGHRAHVAKPLGVVRLDYEPELVFVIGKRALGAKKAQAFDHVMGVTILNDLTCRDMQQREVASGSRFWTAKNIPGFGPLGPEIVTMDEIPDPYNLWMVCRVNGQERMRVNTFDQIWKLGDILEHFSRLIPIEPGDMFSTGAPGGVAVGKANAAELFLKPGDVVECAIEGITTLSTTIVAPEDLA